MTFLPDNHDQPQQLYQPSPYNFSRPHPPPGSASSMHSANSFKANSGGGAYVGVNGVLQGPGRPALMSLLDYGVIVRDEGWRILLVIGVSTLLVMVVTAFTVEAVCRWRMRHEV